jgi:hypothetical protein
MVFALLSIAIATFLLVLGVVIAAKRRIKALELGFSGLLSFFVAENEDEPSQFAVVLQNLMSGAATSLGAKFAASNSQVKRQENAIMKDALSDMIEAQNPLIGALSKMFPSVLERVTKNESAMPALMNLINSGALQKFLPQGGGAPDNGNGAANVMGLLKKVNYGY